MIMDATAALVAGAEAWQAEAATQVFLLRSVAGRTGREVPDLPVAQLVRDLRRATADGVPAPLPRPAPSPSVLDDADKQPEGSGKNTWSPPVIANGKMYLRDQDMLFCYDIKGK